jgi:cell wall-associated NlpC family hydrolase
MSEQEIMETQKFRNLFAYLNPEFVTYELKNLYFGAIDIHNSIFIEEKSLTKKASYGKPRISTGYQVRHTFTQIYPNQATLTEDFISNPDAAKKFTPRFGLTTEITFLEITAGPTDLLAYDQIERKYSNLDQDFLQSDLNLFDTIDSCGMFGAGVDVSALPIAEPGTPGNENVANSAQTLINAGFVYLWGGMQSKAMDCSGFTMWAVRNGGGDQGRATRYPKGTTAQITWLTNPQNGALRIENVEDIQPGDIVFFKTSRCGHCHTGIAVNNSEYYHSNSVKKKGADIGSFARRRPSYIFRLLPMNTKKVEDKKEE